MAGSESAPWPTFPPGPPLVEGFRTLLKGGVAVAADGIGIRRALPHGHAVAVLARCGPLASTGGHVFCSFLALLLRAV
jgi:hypothetical protein